MEARRLPTLEPRKAYVERRILESKDRLEALQLETKYILRFPKISWMWWSFDSIDEVMRYAGDQGSGSLGSATPVDLVCDDAVKFCTAK